MGIQINGNTDTISAIDGGLTVSGASLGSASASSLNISGIVTASGFSGNLTGTASTATAAATAYGLSGSPTLSGITSVSTTNLTVNGNSYPSDGPISGARNRIINGDMRIDQRNNGASVSITGGTSNYAADRFNLYVNTGTCTLQRVADSPTGFLYSDKVTVSSAGSSSSGASNAVHFEQKIEGYNIDDLGVGTSNAKTITLSFWIKSSVTGTYSLHFGNDTDRYYVTTYVINSANTWEYKTKTITLSTSGTWNTINGRGLEIVWSLLGGSNYQTSSTDQWISAEDYHASGAVQFAENASATWQVTGVQLEAGTVATPFERRSYGQELALCQRYYYRVLSTPVNGGNYARLSVSGLSASSTTAFVQVMFPVTMRTAPSSVETTGTPSNYQVATSTFSAVNATSITFNIASAHNGEVSVATAGSLSSGNSTYLVANNNTTAYLGWSAEL